MMGEATKEVTQGICWVDANSFVEVSNSDLVLIKSHVGEAAPTVAMAAQRAGHENFAGLEINLPEAARALKDEIIRRIDNGELQDLIDSVNPQPPPAPRQDPHDWPSPPPDPNRSSRGI